MRQIAANRFYWHTKYYQSFKDQCQSKKRALNLFLNSLERHRFVITLLAN